MTMNREFITLLIYVLVASCTRTDTEILSKTFSKLNSLNNVELQNTIHYNQKDMGLNKMDTAICYFDFTSKDTLLGARYIFKYISGEQVYNGSSAFSLDKNEERIIYNNSPKAYDVNSSIHMLYSVLTLKKLLPVFLSDTTVVIQQLRDTILYGEENYNFNISLKDKYINIGAVLSESKNGSNYNLFISKKTFLPTQFKTNFPENKGFWCSTFLNYNFKTSYAEEIWDIDSKPKKYLRISKQELARSYKQKSAVQIGQTAPDWKLPLVGGNDSIQMSTLNNNLVLLEFWFPYCSGCVKANPTINKIEENYSDKGLKVFGIEFAQSNDKGLRDYIQKQKIQYPTLHTGKNVAQDYGISAAPTFYLIDEKGLIKYTSVGLNEDELVNAIEENLKNFGT